MAEQWLSIVEYARTYDVSDMTVRRRIKTGKLHAVLKDGKYFIPVQVGADGRGPSPEGPSLRTFEGGYEAQVHAKGEIGGYRGRRDMVVIKGHPSANKTYANVPVEPSIAYANERDTNRHSGGPPMGSSLAGEFDRGPYAVPSSLRRPLQEHESSLVDTKALLAFCEASLKKMAELERRQVEKFKGKLEALEATLANRELEIRQLRQQVEDLQLLVKILEKKNAG